MPCLLFFWQDNCDINLEKVLHILAHKICPVLLQTIIKGIFIVLVLNLVFYVNNT